MSPPSHTKLHLCWTMYWLGRSTQHKITESVWSSF